MLSDMESLEHIQVDSIADLTVAVYVDESFAAEAEVAQ